MAMIDFQSFYVMIDPPMTSALCVQGYVLTIIEDGGTNTTMNLNVSGIDDIENLNLCNNIYSFTAYATTGYRNGELSDPVEGHVNFSGKNYLIFSYLKKKKISFLNVYMCGLNNTFIFVCICK